MNLNLNQVKKIIGGTYQGDEALLKKKIKRISINSNDIHKDDLFIGIKGEKFNGDLFASSAIQKGAIAAIISTNQKDGSSVNRTFYISSEESHSFCLHNFG